MCAWNVLVGCDDVASWLVGWFPRATSAGEVEVPMTVIGDNVQAEIQDNILILSIDLTQNFGLSGSGKSEIIASTGGNVSLPGLGEVKIGLNVYRPRKLSSSNGR